MASQIYKTFSGQHHVICITKPFPEDRLINNPSYYPTAKLTLVKHSESLFSSVLHKCQVIPEVHNQQTLARSKRAWKYSLLLYQLLPLQIKAKYKAWKTGANLVSSLQLLVILPEPFCSQILQLLQSLPALLHTL